jgi:hypothetical protein
MRAEIARVGELVAALAAFPPQTRVRWRWHPATPKPPRSASSPAAPMTPRGTHAHPPPRTGRCGSAKAPHWATCPRSLVAPSGQGHAFPMSDLRLKPPTSTRARPRFDGFPADADAERVCGSAKAPSSATCPR